MRKIYLKDVETGNIFTSSSYNHVSEYTYPYCKPNYNEIISYLKKVRDKKFDSLGFLKKFIFNFSHQKIEDIDNVVFGEVLENEIETLCILRKEFV